MDYEWYITYAENGTNGSTPISICSCPEVASGTPTASENDLKQLVIVAIVSFVLSLTKMVSHQVSSIARKKDLHSKLEVIQQTFKIDLNDPQVGAHRTEHRVLSRLDKPEKKPRIRIILT